MPSHGKLKKKGKRSKASQIDDTPRFQTFANHSAGAPAKGIRVGFPANRTVDLNYCELLSFACTAGVLNTYQFRINSAFDPNYTAGGHQPMGFDQWAQYYNHYVVESVEYQIMVGPASYVPMFYSAHLSDDNSVPTNPYELMELGAEASAYIGTIPPHIFSGKVDFAKFFNRKDIATDDQLRATTSANPSENAFLTLSAVPFDGVTTITNYFICKLTQRVRFMEPRDLPPSSSITQVSPPTSEVTTLVFPTLGKDDYIVVSGKQLPLTPELKSKLNGGPPGPRAF